MTCTCVFVAGTYHRGDIIVEDGEEGVIYVNDDMSLADTDDSANEINFDVCDSYNTC